ncbi:MAG: two component transcriptional regulator, winged helix family [Parcubacteria group bacterium]|nr:two component transcriptional regulator, winged helix family [Parcubacteria group bacterium]
MKLLIIEDDPQVSAFLKRSFEAESFAVDTADDGEKGSFHARTNEYDAIILDNMLPKKQGIDVCRDIRKANNPTPILMLSVKSDIPEKVILLEAGVDDYMTKPYSYDELSARIRSLLRRKPLIEVEIYTFGDLSIDLTKQKISLKGKDVYLTRKEFSLLELLVKNTGHIVSRGRIMEHVWDMNGNPFSRTIETHILNLRKKIETKTEKYIHNIPGRGYKFDLIT